MPRYRLTIEYDGGPFTGWQSQAGGTSVQDVLERAVPIWRATHDHVDAGLVWDSPRDLRAELRHIAYTLPAARTEGADFTLDVRVKS